MNKDDVYQKFKNFNNPHYRIVLFEIDKGITFQKSNVDNINDCTNYTTLFEAIYFIVETENCFFLIQRGGITKIIHKYRECYFINFRSEHIQKLVLSECEDYEQIIIKNEDLLCFGVYYRQYLLYMEVYSKLLSHNNLFFSDKEFIYQNVTIPISDITGIGFNSNEFIIEIRFQKRLVYAYNLSYILNWIENEVNKRVCKN